MHVLVLLGGLSAERSVSIASGTAIAKALQEKGYEVSLFDPALGKDGLIEKHLLEEGLALLNLNEQAHPSSYIEAMGHPIFSRCDVVFNICHGQWGEDGYLQSLLEMKGLCCIDNSSLASKLAMDKDLSKRLLSSQIPCAEHRLLKSPHDPLDLFTDQVVIKPNTQGSTVGIEIGSMNDTAFLESAIKKAFTFAPEVMVEAFIPGRELTVAVIDGEAYPPVEICPEGGFYDFKHKYEKGATIYHCPAPISKEIEEQVCHYAQLAHQTLGCSLVSRSDFRLDPQEKLFYLETNTLPGFTSTSLVPMAAKAKGMDFAELVDHLVTLASKRSTILT